MAMVNVLEATDKPHRNDDVRMQQAQEIGDYAALCLPGYWIFVGPGSEKDPELRQVGSRHSRTATGTGTRGSFFKTEKESGHPVVLGTTIFEHGKTRREMGKRTDPLQREHGDRQHDLPAARVGESPLPAARHQEAHG